MGAKLGDADAYEYPYNLVSDVIGSQHMEEWKAHEPPDILETIESILSRFSDRDERVMKYRYRDHLTYSQIGKLEGRTVERMRQVIARNIRQLKRSFNRNRIIYGNQLTPENEEEQRRRDKLIFYASVIVDKLAAKGAQERYDKSVRSVNRYYQMQLTEKAKYVITHEGMRYCNELFPMLLGETLYLNGIRYVWQLALYSEVDLKSICHFSLSDIKLIKDKLREFGWGLSENRFLANMQFYTKLKEEFIVIGLLDEED